MFSKQYTEKDVEKLVEMWQEGKTATEIGHALRKSQYSVRLFVHRNRHKYDFEKRAPGRPFSRTAFDRHWHGIVPCGHWMVTKPWKKHSIPTQNQEDVNQ